MLYRRFPDTILCLLGPYWNSFVFPWTFIWLDCQSRSNQDMDCKSNIQRCVFFKMFIIMFLLFINKLEKKSWCVWKKFMFHSYLINYTNKQTINYFKDWGLPWPSFLPWSRCITTLWSPGACITYLRLWRHIYPGRTVTTSGTRVPVLTQRRTSRARILGMDDDQIAVWLKNYCYC